MNVLVFLVNWGPKKWSSFKDAQEVYILQGKMVITIFQTKAALKCL